MDYDIILVNGAPGVGKTTLSQLLGEHFKSPVIDFGRLREFHLDKRWERKSDQEEQMTFEVLVQMLHIYMKYGLKNTFVNDLQEWRVKDLCEKFTGNQVMVLSLVVSDYSVLKERIETRNCGWRDVDAAWKRNQQTLEREPWSNEIRVDVSMSGIDVVLQRLKEILEVVNK